MRRAEAITAIAVLLGMAGCDLPPGIDTLDPGEAEPTPVGTAEVDAVPGAGFAPTDDERWETDFLGWQPGGTFTCAVTRPPVGAGQLPGEEEPEPIVVELWDGVTAPCDEEPDLGDRRIRIELSDSIPGTYSVAPVCTGPLSAGVTFTEIVSRTQERTLVATGGTVSIFGVQPQDDAVEGAFSVTFEGETGFTSGGFLAGLACF